MLVIIESIPGEVLVISWFDHQSIITNIPDLPLAELPEYICPERQGGWHRVEVQFLYRLQIFMCAGKILEGRPVLRLRIMIPTKGTPVFGHFIFFKCRVVLGYLGEGIRNVKILYVIDPRRPLGIGTDLFHVGDIHTLNSRNITCLVEDPFFFSFFLIVGKFRADIHGIQHLVQFDIQFIRIILRSADCMTEVGIYRNLKTGLRRQEFTHLKVGGYINLVEIILVPLI